MMDRYSFLPGMTVECTGEIRLDRGRVVVHQPKSMEISGSGSGESWTLDRALVAVKTARLMKSQPEPCLACQWGALADVIDKRDREEEQVSQSVLS